MQPLSLNSAPLLPGPLDFLFTKLRFGLQSMAVYLPPIESLDNSNGILISRPSQNIYNLERPTEHIYNLNIFWASMHVQYMWLNVGHHSSIPQSAASAIEGQDAQK
jgi:hypothetical protein